MTLLTWRRRYGVAGGFDLGRRGKVSWDLRSSWRREEGEAVRTRFSSISEEGSWIRLETPKVDGCIGFRPFGGWRRRVGC